MRWYDNDHRIFCREIFAVVFRNSWRHQSDRHAYRTFECRSYLHRPMFLTRRRSNNRSRQLAARPQPSDAWWYLRTRPDMFKRNTQLHLCLHLNAIYNSASFLYKLLFFLQRLMCYNKSYLSTKYMFILLYFMLRYVKFYLINVIGKSNLVSRFKYVFVAFWRPIFSVK